MKIPKLILFCLLILCILPTAGHAQVDFAAQCEGHWKGKLMIYANGILRDSVNITLDISPIDGTNWIWKTSYHSEQYPMVKDYKMISEGGQVYIMDEGNEIELINYLFGDKLYCIFETEEVLLTSSYELVEDRLIFEVTSGKMNAEERGGVRNYPVSHVQRAVLRKVKQKS